MYLCRVIKKRNPPLAQYVRNNGFVSLDAWWLFRGISVFVKMRKNIEDIKLTKKGYVRIYHNGKSKMLHVLVWEKYFGEVPDGYQIHHIDGNKTNNDINNLQLVTILEHKRIHEGCKFVVDEWYKPCSACGEYKRCDKENWYFSKKGWIVSGLCKKCFVKKVVEDRRIRVSKGWKRKEYRK